VKRIDLVEFEQIVEGFKADLQHEANQWVLKRDVNAAAASLAAIEAVNRLMHRVTARAFSLGERPETEEQPKRVKMWTRRTKKQMEEARGKVRDISSKKVG
jgi:hypothetical protein